MLRLFALCLPLLLALAVPARASGHRPAAVNKLDKLSKRMSLGVGYRTRTRALLGRALQPQSDASRAKLDRELDRRMRRGHLVEVRGSLALVKAANAHFSGGGRGGLRRRQRAFVAAEKAQAKARLPEERAAAVLAKAFAGTRRQRVDVGDEAMAALKVATDELEARPRTSAFPGLISYASARALTPRDFVLFEPLANVADDGAIGILAIAAATAAEHRTSATRMMIYNRAFDIVADPKTYGDANVGYALIAMALTAARDQPYGADQVEEVLGLVSGAFRSPAGAGVGTGAGHIAEAILTVPGTRAASRMAEWARRTMDRSKGRAGMEAAIAMLVAARGEPVAGASSMYR